MTKTPAPLDRRSFLKGAVGTGAGLALASPFGAFAARSASAAQGGGVGQGKPTAGGYGPLVPVKDQTTGLELLLLPAGFEYLSFGWTNDLMSDGTRTPGAHDGMAAFGDKKVVSLVRNHERGQGAPFGPAGMTYDPAAGGGTTTLRFDTGAGALVDDRASLTGTIRNCAGGATPGGSWLSCEETTEIIGGVRHGYVFEVPSEGPGSPVPIKAMGRFSHEATATDPTTGIVYETEDNGSSLLYRYIPADPAVLAAGGRLEAMVLEGTSSTFAWGTGMTANASWVTITSPDPEPAAPSPRAQGTALGAATIRRGEGAWYGNDLVYVVSTNGGTAGQGQIFAYDPVASTFTCVFASPGSNVLNAPDNICVSPRGGLVLCEDGSGLEYLHGLTPDGRIFQLAQNNVVLPASFQASKGYSGDFTSSEWAGACFDPKKGEWLFANLQSPGITFAITGPWNKGAL